MKKRTLVLIAAMAVLISAWPGAASADAPVTLYYGDVTLGGRFQAGHFPQIWDLTASDLVLRFTADLNGMVDDLDINEDGLQDAHAWAELGVRMVGYGDFSPTRYWEGAGVWLATDYHWAANTFDPDPPGSPILDLDDKLYLQKAGTHGEGDYDLPSTPPDPGANHRVWFDRDGVDQWQARSPLAVDRGTHNTSGRYEVVITLHATTPTSGEAYMRINGLSQGFETDGNWNTMELSPAGMTFTGDMTRMQVFYGLFGYGATHSVAFEDIEATGCLVLEEDMATGGGWFIPELDRSNGLVNQGGKASFGFIAKQKPDTSSGELEFQYQADELNLKSTSCDWVTVSTMGVIFEGEGRLNGEPGYRFRVSAFDGDRGRGQLDRFTIRIWTGDGDSYASPTYRAKGSLSGGQIVVHKE